MRLKMKTWFLALAGLMVVATAAFAEDYPTRPVRMIVGYAPGGATDTVGRVLAQKLTEILKQSFIVENRPGAGSMLAAGQVARATPDGYTLFVNDMGQIAIFALLDKSLSYDPVTAFKPVALAATLPLVLISSPKTTDFKTIADLVRYAKANPGKLNFGSPGIGSPHHIAMEAFSADAGIALTNVPYRGSADIVNALLGGQVQVALAALPSAGAYAKTGQVTMLGVTSPKRFPGAPDVPSIAEVYKGYDQTSQMGVMAPAGIPPEIAAKLAGAIKIAVEDPVVKEKFFKLGLVSSWLSSTDYAENARQNRERLKKVIDAAHITLQ